MGGRKLVEYGFHLYILVLNKMLLDCVSGMYVVFPFIVVMNCAPICAQTKMEKPDSYSQRERQVVISWNRLSFTNMS